MIETIGNDLFVLLQTVSNKEKAENEGLLRKTKKLVDEYLRIKEKTTKGKKKNAKN